MDRTIENKVTEVGNKLAEAAEQVAETTATKARGAAQDISAHLSVAAESLQTKIRQTRQDAAEAVSSATDRMRSSAQYMKDEGIPRLMDDVETLIRRYPIHAVVLGIGVGFLLASRGKNR